MAADRYERRHRRTARNVNCIQVMANADFDAVPSLSEAMGLEEPASKPPTPAAPCDRTEVRDNAGVYRLLLPVSCCVCGERLTGPRYKVRTVTTAAKPAPSFFYSHPECEQ